MMQDGSTGEAVYLRLKAALIDCAIDPHSRLDVARVADRFEVSATPVREAAMRLLGEGLLERHPSGGTRPLQTSEYGLRSMLELHGHLTEMAVRIIGNGAIAPGPSDDQIAPETRERQFLALSRRQQGSRM